MRAGFFIQPLRAEQVRGPLARAPAIESDAAAKAQFRPPIMHPALATCIEIGARLTRRLVDRKQARAVESERHAAQGRAIRAIGAKRDRRHVTAPYRSMRRDHKDAFWKIPAIQSRSTRTRCGTCRFCG
jgi:hypothetical protein